MLQRYTKEPMAQLWLDPQTKFFYWLKVELAVLRARVKLGEIAPEVPEAIQDNAAINVARIDELENGPNGVGHDMIAFIMAVQESLQQAGVPQNIINELHQRVTSYDIEDPALVLMLRQALELIIKELTDLQYALQQQADKHRQTIMIARSHGQYAEPDSFGRLLLSFASDIKRSVKRLQYILDEELCEAKISGAVGNYAGMDPRIEKLALAELGLRPAKVETQILQRDRHAMMMSVIAIAGASIERLAKTLWVMMRSDVGELQEPRGKKQRGSSRMPQKRNPILTEQLFGLPRLLRGAVQPALEDIATIECREISQSSVERHIFPDATSQLHYMAARVTKLIQNLIVFPERMQENLECSYDTWAGGPLKDALLTAGVDPTTVYEFIQGACFQAQDGRTPLLTVLNHLPLSATDHRTIYDLLPVENITALMDPWNYIQAGVDHAFSSYNNL